MSLTLLIWMVLLAGLAIGSVQRPVLAVVAYLLTFFLSPPFWWWGDPIAGYRWNFYVGFLLLGASFLCPAPTTSGRIRPLVIAGGLMVLNAAVVHFAFGGGTEVSADPFTLMMKFLLLVYLMNRTIKDVSDLQIVMLSMILGAAYIGYEVTFNDRGAIVNNRLEGVGAPGATTANHFASLMVTVLPLVAPFFLVGKNWMRFLVVLSAPMIINVVLLCNSRGAFLAAILTGVVFACVAPTKVRRKAWITLGVGAFAVFLMLGDQRIIDRFMTTFSSGEERDSSAQSRLDFWGCALEMISDHPLGAGGHGFKKVHGVKYLRKNGVSDVARAVHNGYLNEACEWGIQGLLLRLFWFFVAVRISWQVIRNSRGDPNFNEFLLLAMCAVMSGFVGYLLTCLFGDMVSAEWGYWMVAMIIAIATLAEAQAPTIDGVTAQ